MNSFDRVEATVNENSLTPENDTVADWAFLLLSHYRDEWLANYKASVERERKRRGDTEGRRLRREKAKAKKEAAKCECS